jgi:hypothetical protein
MRPVLVLAALATLTAPALAAPGPRTLKLVASEPGSTTQIFATTDAFPAVAADGTIAELFHDEEDFTGAPITTLVVWSRTGKRLGAFELGGMAEQKAGVAKRKLAAANKLLAAHSWESLTAATHCTDERELCFDGDVHVRLDDKGQLSTQVGTHAAHAVKAVFPAPGSASAEIGGGSCGDITGLDRGFAGKGIVIVVPRVSLGGDSCTGSPTADLAIAVRVTAQ